MKRKIILILSLLLILTPLLSSCKLKQTNNTQTPFDFNNTVVYSSKGKEIRFVNLDGKNDRLIVSKDDVLKLYSKAEEFNELRLDPLCVSTDKHNCFFR
jgi:hypothetical protein